MGRGSWLHLTDALVVAALLVGANRGGECCDQFRFVGVDVENVRHVGEVAEKSRCRRIWVYRVKLLIFVSPEIHAMTWIRDDEIPVLLE